MSQLGKEPNIKEVTDSNFSSEVLESAIPVLVDFWADWCGPCNRLAPWLEEIAQATPAIKIVKMNVDKHQVMPTKYGIRSIPTMLIFAGGTIVSTKMGANSKHDVQEWINSQIGQM